MLRRVLPRLNDTPAQALMKGMALAALWQVGWLAALIVIGVMVVK